MWSDTSQREVLLVSEDWTISEVMDALLAALRGDGPALGFGGITHTHVPDSCAVIVPTSGSSGTPKEVALTASALISSARASHQYLEATVGERWSLLLPLSHIAGVNVLVRSLELGTTPQTIESEVEYTAIVPTQLHRALTKDVTLLEHLKKCKAVLVGGAATDPTLLEAARSAGINVVTTYGMSEMSGGCVYNNQPIGDTEVRINSDGQVELKGSSMAIGYLSRESFGEWFTTNDLGEMRDGKLYIAGRADDQINSGGEKVSLSVIDDYLHETFPRLRFTSFAIPDPEWGQKLVLACDGAMDSELIKSSLREKLGAHSVPKAIFFNVDIPLISIGKPDRNQLAEKFERLT